MTEGRSDKRSPDGDRCRRPVAFWAMHAAYRALVLILLGWMTTELAGQRTHCETMIRIFIEAWTHGAPIP